MAKSLKFKSSLVPQILSEEKNSTWRLFDDKNIGVGDSVSLVNKDTLVGFGSAVVTAVLEKKLCNLQDSDFEGHERYESDEEMYNEFRRYYGDKVTPESVIKIIKFKLSKKSF